MTKKLFTGPEKRLKKLVSNQQVQLLKRNSINSCNKNLSRTQKKPKKKKPKERTKEKLKELHA